MNNYLLPIPFYLSPYGMHDTSALDEILKVSGSSPNYSSHFPQSTLQESGVTILDPVPFDLLPNDEPHIGSYLKSAVSMQYNTAHILESILPTAETVTVIGGDHSIAIGTGLGLSKCYDMADIGLIWIDAHGDANTPETSLSKSITGYPAAVVSGHVPESLVTPFENNHIKKMVHLGVRDLDRDEEPVLQQLATDVYSIIDIEHLGLPRILDSILETLCDCKMLWVSIDADCLDSIYFEPQETDLPVTGGLTPRELIYILYRIQQTGKLKVTELVQLNSLHKQTSLVSLFHRLTELSFGLGYHRYAKKQNHYHVVS